MKMRGVSCFAACAAILLAAASASAATKVFDFEDGTDQGWGSSFGADDASQVHPIVNIGGSNRMEVNLGGFQVASINSSANPYLEAINTALANPGLSTISYDWYVDTAGFTGATFLQMGTYVNAGNPPNFPYKQDFDTPANRAELNGTQLASGSAFSGTNTFTVAQRYGALTADFLNAPSQRLGLILNGDGTNVKVYFDNITIVGVPEPATIALLGLVVPALLVARRRRS
jgi:hypothetical protein